ncbi:MAG: DNA primase [Candidatus Aminicenantes bacterium]|nr:DNA primase [Candidatus Aminicenantes bacterium]
MEIIDEIRQVANIIDIASQYTTLKKRGQKYVGLCPFHSEKDPSFTVDEDKQLFHCFGCGAGGDIFTLVMEKENLSFPEALSYLAQKYNLTLPQKKKLSPALLKLEEKLYKINEEALGFFRKNLFNTQEGKNALGYLLKRGISNEVIQKLKIGYASNSWDSLLSFFKEKNTDLKLLEKAGLVIQRTKGDGYYDRFRGRVIFPIFTLTGKVVAFGGRTIYDDDPKYLNSPDTPIFTKGKLLYGLNFCKDSIREKGEMILVEGYTDFLSLFQAGVTNVAASLGTSLTSDQASLARRFASKIIVSYDRDASGEKAASRAISICLEKGVQVKAIILPKGFDPDSFIKKHGPDRFNSLISESVPGMKFLIDEKLKEGRMDVPEEKAKVIQSIASEIEKIPDPVVRNEYLKQASEYLSIDETFMRSIIQKKSSQKPYSEKEYFLPAEKRLLQIIFEDSLIATGIVEDINDDDYKGLKSEPVFQAFKEFFKLKKPPNFNEFRKKIDPTLFSCLSKILMEKGSPPSLKEARYCIAALREFSFEKQSKALKAQITTMEKNGKIDQLPNLMKQLQELKRQQSILSQRDF